MKPEKDALGIKLDYVDIGIIRDYPYKYGKF